MHSRAYLLLEREFQEYKNAGIFGISVTPLEDNFMEWAAEIQGLKDSLWEGAVLQLVMKYTENYNKVPPSINFTTIPFHPNVDPATGRPCVDFLDDPSKWNMKLTMSSILLIIQVMLSNPVLDNAVNTEAAKILKNNISLYRKRVIKCVTASQRLEAVAVTEQQPTTSIKFYVAPEESTPQQPRIAGVSYEEYYLTWFQIATSRVDREFQKELFADPNFIANYYSWMAENAVKGEWDADIHRILLSELIEKRKNAKLFKDLIEKRKNVKVFKDTENIANTTPAPSEHEKSTTPCKIQSINQEEEFWEQEVDDLVNWSNTLG
ncbi:ubiquitin-conjugating enzyme E2 U isoform X2 [Sphaerodactylus townsendi]|uniref:ubiquitin-conjugating enzyme E2 U isoform X2 n=1 Tax=Sphaerodactylus townsendi TaxID=933632 RepID=UPI002026438C|nr:ubiquitin-conjugating enzyme E2 U isoform X2 [Sphaerodactylus townsendi]